MNQNVIYPKRRMEIDYEGYPIFSAIRVDDEVILQEYFDTLKRAIPGETKAPLLAKCGGVDVWIDAFDCPLVAQTIANIDDSSCEWVFLGGRSIKVFFSELSVDQWNRIHTFISKEKIPAVLSRKAQAEFFNKINTDQINLREYYEENKELRWVDNAEGWDKAYQSDKQGWEMGGPNPALVYYGIPKLLAKKAKLLVPGAGRGHDAVWLDRQGCEVTALDFSSQAKVEFTKLYPSSKVSYVTEDIFKYLEHSLKQFDAVFEHTIFCAIHPSRRTDYLAKIANSLKVGGLYFGFFFVQTWKEGPPFGTTQWELKMLIEEKFNIKTWEISMHSHPARQLRELWAIFEKK